MLRRIYNENKGWLSVTYFMMIGEFAIFAFLPFILGRTVDTLIEGNYRCFWLYVAVSLAGLIIGTARRRLDTRVFIGAWASSSVAAIREMDEKGVPRAKALSRAGMVQTFSDFYEFTIPNVVAATVNAVVAFCMIYSVLHWLGLAVGGITLFAILVSWFFSYQIRKMQEQIQSLREQADHRIIHTDLALLETDYAQLTKVWIHRSDLDAMCWRTIHLCWIIAEVLCVVALVQTGQSAGNVMATIMYVGKLIDQSGQFSIFFTHLKAVEVANHFLEKNEQESATICR